MKNPISKITLFFLVLLTACSNVASNQNVNSPANNNSDNAQKINPPAQSSDEPLRKKIEQLALAAKGHVGVKALVLETGKNVALNPAEHFPMQSVYKLPIGMAVMRQIDDGKLSLNQKVRVEKSELVKAGQYSPLRDKNPNGAELPISELLELAVSESDGTASDVLFRLAGGAKPIQNYLSELNVSEMIILNTEKELGQNWETQYQNWASPAGAVELLRAVYEKRGLSEQSNALIVDLLTGSPIKRNRLKGLLPKDAVVAHKTGTSGSRNGITAATNDIGLITLPNGKHLAIAVFVSDSPADEKTRELVIAQIAKAVWDEWGS